MPSNICKKSGLASFSFSQNKIEKTAFLKGFRGISPLKTPATKIVIKKKLLIIFTYNFF